MPLSERHGLRARGTAGWPSIMLPASWLTILAMVIALLGNAHSSIAGENLKPQLTEWRDHSTAISGDAARALIERQFTASIRDTWNRKGSSPRRLPQPPLLFENMKSRDACFPARRRSILKPSG